MNIGKGTVIFWENYEFENGEKKNSLFLILSDCRFGCFLAIRPTTKTEFYEKPTSSVAREFLIIPSKYEKSIPEKSAIDFTKIRFLYAQKIESEWDKSIKKVGSVSSDLLGQIEQIIAQSKIVRRDWIKWILESPR